jgi:hypothetical protein
MFPDCVYPDVFDIYDFVTWEKPGPAVAHFLLAGCFF